MPGIGRLFLSRLMSSLSMSLNPSSELCRSGFSQENTPPDVKFSGLQNRKKALPTRNPNSERRTRKPWSIYLAVFLIDVPFVRNDEFLNKIQILEAENESLRSSIQKYPLAFSCPILGSLRDTKDWRISSFYHRKCPEMSNSNSQARFRYQKRRSLSCVFIKFCQLSFADTKFRLSRLSTNTLFENNLKASVPKAVHDGYSRLLFFALNFLTPGVVVWLVKTRSSRFDDHRRSPDCHNIYS